jgi:hypothetical protein
MNFPHDSRIEPLNRSSRRKEALTSSVANSLSLLMSATRSMRHTETRRLSRTRRNQIPLLHLQRLGPTRNLSGSWEWFAIKVLDGQRTSVSGAARAERRAPPCLVARRHHCALDWLLVRLPHSKLRHAPRPSLDFGVRISFGFRPSVFIRVDLCPSTLRSTATEDGAVVKKSVVVGYINYR